MKQSAGLLLYRNIKGKTEVLLAHPGGPFWAKKDMHAWSIPKGEFTDPEQPLAAAKREFHEEIGSPAPEGALLDLGTAKQSSGKMVFAWAVEGDLDVTKVKSNMISIEWPPKSGQQQEFPEIDKAAWFTFSVARRKLFTGQLPLLEALAKELGVTEDVLSSENTQTTLF